MQFLFQPLTWGFLLVGVPVLIHLINMLRHRKVQWAAMDFLLESHRRNRRWVMLKQWLLLAARMLAMFLLVAMLAQWVSSSQLLGLLGGQATHHYILLDDSYSMAEGEQAESAYARGLQALGGLVRSIANQPGQNQLTLLRLSRATLSGRASTDLKTDNSPPPADNPTPATATRINDAADLMAQSVPRDPGKLLDRLNATAPTALQVSPEDALDLISPLITGNTAEKSQVYLVSDFRRNEFGEPELLKNKLRALMDASTGIHFIDCASDTSANLSVASVEPEQEVWAAGVPLMVRFQIRNQSPQAARNVVVKIRSVTYAERGAAPHVDSAYSGEVTDLPPVVIEQIEAGESVTRQVQVVFGVPGKHVVEVNLPDDSLAPDNRRWCVIGIRSSQRVLLVDGDIDQSNAFYFQTVLAPDARLRTGMTSERVDASYLRDVPPETLEQFDVVALLDVPRLEPQAVAKLEAYARAGGGVFFACGDNTNLNWVNETLYRGGEGLFPVELTDLRENAEVAGDIEPQVTAEDHPILAPLRQLSASPFSLLRIRKQIVPSTESCHAAGVDWVATGPAQSPLIIDRGYGQGRVVVLLTGLSSDWSNWAQDPTFVVLALRTFGYLGSFRRSPTSEPIGSPIELVATGTAVLPDAEILLPARDGGTRMRLLRKVQTDTQDKLVSRVTLAIHLNELDRDIIDGMLRPGIFEAWMIDSQGENLFGNFAHNVNAAEGNLERVRQSELEQKLAGIAFDYRTAEAVSGVGLNSPAASHSTLLMCLLAALLLGEQLLAYSASYHAPRTVGATR